MGQLEIGMVAGHSDSCDSCAFSGGAGHGAWFSTNHYVREQFIESAVLNNLVIRKFHLFFISANICANTSVSVSPGLAGGDPCGQFRSFVPLGHFAKRIRTDEL